MRRAACPTCAARQRQVRSREAVVSVLTILHRSFAASQFFLNKLCHYVLIRLGTTKQRSFGDRFLRAFLLSDSIPRSVVLNLPRRPAVRREDNRCAHDIMIAHAGTRDEHRWCDATNSTLRLLANPHPVQIMTSNGVMAFRLRLCIHRARSRTIAHDRARSCQSLRVRPFWPRTERNPINSSGADVHFSCVRRLTNGSSGRGCISRSRAQRRKQTLHRRYAPLRADRFATPAAAAAACVLSLSDGLSV